MSNIFDNNMKNIATSLKDLGFSRHEIKVYLALTELGEAKASKIAKKSEMPRTSVISILERLVEQNFVTTHVFRGTTYYWVESPGTIAEIFENKVKIAQNLEKVLSDLYRSDTKFPHAQICDTKQSIKNFTERLLVSIEKSSEIHTIDSPHMGNYQKVLSSDYNNLLVEIKERRKIVTKTLIPEGAFSLVDKQKISDQHIYIREMPEGIKFTASIWFVGDLMVFFSGNPPFVVAIEHDFIVKSFKSIFDFLWNLGEEKFKPKSVE